MLKPNPTLDFYDICFGHKNMQKAKMSSSMREYAS